MKCNLLSQITTGGGGGVNYSIGRGGGGSIQVCVWGGGEGGSMLRGGDVQYRVGGSYLSDSFL